MILASRGREPTDTGHVSESTPEGVAFAVRMGIDYRPDAADRSVVATGSLECHPVGVWRSLPSLTLDPPGGG